MFLRLDRAGNNSASATAIYIVGTRLFRNFLSMLDNQNDKQPVLFLDQPIMFFQLQLVCYNNCFLRQF